MATAAGAPVNPWGIAVAFAGVIVVVIAANQVKEGLPSPSDLIPSPGDLFSWLWDLPQDTKAAPATKTAAAPASSVLHPTGSFAVALGQPAGAHPGPWQ